MAGITCLECGGPVDERPANRSGAQQLLCSAECKKLRHRKTHRRWCIENDHSSKRAPYRKEYKAKNPDYFKVHYANNRERKKKASNDWYHANSEQALQQQKAYARAHPEQIRASGRKSSNKRRALNKQVFVESVDPEFVFRRDKGICGICRKRVNVRSDWHVDHVIPISRGGAHSYANVQLTHGRCNRAKGAKLPAGQPTLFQVVV